MILEIKALLVTPETQEEIDTGAISTLAPMRVIDTGAIATLAPMRVIDTGAQAITLAKTSDTVIKAPAIDRTATIAKVITAPKMTETPEMIGGLVMIPTAVSRETDTGKTDHPVYMSRRAMVAV